MTFQEAIEIVKQLVPDIKNNSYDGMIVKQLEASNTLDEGRSTNQTHIAITGAQMDIFPYLTAERYFNCEYEKREEELKKYFIEQIPLNIYKSNIQKISDDNDYTIDFAGKEMSLIHTSLVRSRRKTQRDQVQVSLKALDDKAFVQFRKMLHKGDYLIILKHKNEIVYDFLGIKPEREKEVLVEKLKELNNNFYKLLSNTKVDIEKILIRDDQISDISFSDISDILSQMYNEAEERGKVAAIHMFGIKYAELIVKKGYKAQQIVATAGLNDSYVAELNKGINIYRCLKDNRYNVHFLEEDKQKMKDCELSYNTGLHSLFSRNRIAFGAPGTGKSFKLKELPVE